MAAELLRLTSSHGALRCFLILERGPQTLAWRNQPNLTRRVKKGQFFSRMDVIGHMPELDEIGIDICSRRVEVWQVPSISEIRQ